MLEEFSFEREQFASTFQWLKESMEERFFEEVAEEQWISLIIHALVHFELSHFFAAIDLKQASIVLALDTPDVLLRILKGEERPVAHYKSYLSRIPLPFAAAQGGCLRITIFEFVNESEPSIGLPNAITHFSQLAESEKSALLALATCALESEALLAAHIDSIGQGIILLAGRHVPKGHLLYDLAKRAYYRGLSIERADIAYTFDKERLMIMALTLDGRSDTESARSAFLTECALVKLLGEDELYESALVAMGIVPGMNLLLLQAIASFAHQILVHRDLHLYTLENVREGLVRHPELTLQLIRAFELHCDPQCADENAFQEACRYFYHCVKELDTGNPFFDERRKNILFQAMNFIEHILKTNFYVQKKNSIAFRLSPDFLEHVPFDRHQHFKTLPFGLFYFFAPNAIGFHIRFKDLARGGLRTVFPENQERMLAELNEVLLECYQLAATQQIKNKDIPEGGAKGVLFLKNIEAIKQEAARAGKLTEEHLVEYKKEALFEAQVSYIQALLSLVNSDAEGALKEKPIVDYWQRPEDIYLGPDENMHGSMIEWIAQESLRTEYRPGAAFITGKKALGIGHKTYGVTSLGVAVYIDEMLPHLGIDPATRPFTVKMTGGPDGDVGGNLIYNLYKRYHNQAKLIALTDVSGTIFDPNGLNFEILIDLFQKAKPIAFYPPAELSVGGFLLNRNQHRQLSALVMQTACYRKRPEGVELEYLAGSEAIALYRLNVHRTPADLFVPCGGRPHTLREENIDEFLTSEGVPTARAIVEGANLYLSTHARRVLIEKGVLIIKDSAANKGGVIASSFEVLFGLLFSPDEFTHLKEMLVAEVLQRIELLARSEGNLLLKTHQSTLKPLTELSDEISKRILFFTDQILHHLETIELKGRPVDDLFIRALLNYFPTSLRTRYQERILSKIPESHQKAIIASHIASTTVYQRGLDFWPSIIDILPSLIEGL